jgi:tetratricopeptide (TPR) repeat protein
MNACLALGRPRRCFLVLLLLLGVLATAPAGAVAANVYYDDQDPRSDQEIQRYASLQQDAETAFNQGRISDAIGLYEQARQASRAVRLPEESQRALHNNLAAAYIRRANYLMTTQKRPSQAALQDFQKAYFLLSYGLPEGLAQDDLIRANLKIAQQDLHIAYQNLGMPLKQAQPHLQQARQLRAQADFERAAVAYGQALQADPKNIEAAHSLGDVFNLLGLFPQSKRYYAKAVALKGNPLKPEDADLLQRLATAEARTGQWEAAIESLNRAVALNPNHTASLRQLEQIWRREITQAPNNARAIANLAAVLQKQKRYNEALDAYKAAEERARQDPTFDLETKIQLRLNQGTLYQAVKDYPRALAVYDSVLKAKPNHVQATQFKAGLYREAGKPSDALLLYEKLLRLQPNSVSVRETLVALASQHEGASDASSNATPDFEKLSVLADRFPDDALLQAAIGEVYHHHNRLEEARMAYERALSLNPKLASTQANVGAVYQAQGRDALAKKAYQQAVLLEPNLGAAKEALASYQQQAQAVQNQALTEAILARALKLHQTGRHAQALVDINQVIKQTPDLPVAYYYQGLILTALKRPGEARAAYEKSIALDSKFRDSYYALGVLLEGQKQQAAAREAYQQFLNLSQDIPEDDYVRYARTRLAVP